MRGKHVKRMSEKRDLRITPAHAGKTCPPLWYIYSIEDHPRACGENRNNLHIYNPGTGSPPRMRGKRSDDLEKAAYVRITPAHAGKTLDF